jgi:Fic family protein
MHIPPEALQVPLQMEQLIQWYESDGRLLHPVAKAALVHSDFVKIHPFIDGNGRTARLLLNFELMKSGYPPIVIEKETRVEYYSALDEAHTTGDYGKFIQLISGILDQTFDFYLKLI